jgi:hypothetical protein
LKISTIEDFYIAGDTGGDGAVVGKALRSGADNDSESATKKQKLLSFGGFAFCIDKPTEVELYEMRDSGNQCQCPRKHDYYLGYTTQGR